MVDPLGSGWSRRFSFGQGVFSACFGVFVVLKSAIRDGSGVFVRICRVCWVSVFIAFRLGGEIRYYAVLDFEGKEGSS